MHPVYRGSSITYRAKIRTSVRHGRAIKHMEECWLEVRTTESSPPIMNREYRWIATTVANVLMAIGLM